MKRPLDSSKPSFSAPRDESKRSSARLSEKTFNKKRFWLIVAILALVEAVILCLALQWKYIFPSREVSDLYTRYENVDGIAASFIKDYKVNDTVFIDVTLLEAKNDSAWLTLQTNFNIPIIPEEYRELFENTDAIDYWLAPKGKYIPPMDSVLLNNDAVAVSRKMHLVSVFHLTNETQADVIFLKKLHELKSNND